MVSRRVYLKNQPVGSSRHLFKFQTGKRINPNLKDLSEAGSTPHDDPENRAAIRTKTHQRIRF